MTMPITKYNYQIRDTADIPRVITEALHIATTGDRVPLLLMFQRHPRKSC